MKSSTTRQVRIFYGWWIVLAAAILSMYYGGALFYGFTLFVNPIREDLGWSATSISLAFTLQGLLLAPIAPVLGALFDRAGPRPMVIGGMGAAGLGILILSRMESLPVFYMGFLLAALGVSFTFTGTIPCVANWFIRMRGRALGIQGTGFGMAGLLALPIAALLNLIGWRDTYLILAVGTWLLGIPLAFVMRHRPEDLGLYPDGDLLQPDYGTDEEGGEVDIPASRAVKTRTFWLLSLGFTLSFFAPGALGVHQGPILEAIGFSRENVASLIAVLTLTTIVGRLGFGWLADVFDKRLVAGVAIAFQSLGILCFAMLDESRLWLLVPFLLFYAPGFGGAIILRPALQGAYFGRSSFGTVQGLMFTIGSLGFASGPLIAGVLLDATGTSRMAFLAFGLMGFLSIPLIAAARSPTPPSKERSAPGLL